MMKGCAREGLGKLSSANNSVVYGNKVVMSELE